MKIISKFRDYYDSALAYGIDERIIYHRKTERVEDEELTRAAQSHILLKCNVKEQRFLTKYLTTYVVGFCGKLYSFYRLKDKSLPVDLKDVRLLNSSQHSIHYTFNQEVKKHIKESFGWRTFIVDDSIAATEKILNNQGIEHSDIFLKYRVPCFIISDHSGLYYSHADRGPFNEKTNLILNPELSGFDFQKMVDPFTANQEIMSYISGVLGTNENEMVNISDVDMRDAKGFDKMSFKKYPTKKR